MRRAFEKRALSLCFEAGWVRPRLTLSLGYPLCYPSPVLLVSSSASNPHSPIFWALSIARGSATLVLARNCGTAFVALGSPRILPCGYSSAVVGLTTLFVSRTLWSLLLGVAIAGIQSGDGVPSLLRSHILGRLDLPEPKSDVNIFQ